MITVRAYTSKSTVKGNYALESDAFAYKFLRLSPHKKITKG